MAVAIVTGASKGLGRALAGGLADEGWSLVIDARTRQTLQHAEDALRIRLRPGAGVVAVEGDIASADHRSALVDTASQLGRLDLVVNNASSLGETPLPMLQDYSLDALRDVLEVNVIAPVALVQQALPLLRRSGDPRGRGRWAVNEPALYGGNPPQLFRHFRMAERCTPNRIRVELPVH